jgi:hypothetical protein
MQQQLRVSRPAYREGFGDGYDDVGYQNPYELGTEAYEDYKAGYEDGETEAEEEEWAATVDCRCVTSLDEKA